MSSDYEVMFSFRFDNKLEKKEKEVINKLVIRMIRGLSILLECEVLEDSISIKEYK